jgi:hypothetical protein
MYSNNEGVLSVSEFSVGALFLNVDRYDLEDQIIDLENCFIHELNENWCVLLFEDEWVQARETAEWLLSLSQITPLLYFYHAEENGWGYRLLHEGQEHAYACINYDLEIELATELAAEKYPDQNPFEIFDQLSEELNASGSYRSALTGLLANSNVEAFRVFDLDDEPIAQLAHLLSIETLLDDDCLVDNVDQFKEILNIEEFCWLSYAYEADNENELEYEGEEEDL